MMPFEGAEYVFVARADLAETFDEVCKIAQDVYNYAKTQEDEKEKLKCLFLKLHLLQVVTQSLMMK